MTEEAKGSADRGIIDRAVEFLRHCEDAEGENRRLALEDTRFRDGQQWPAEVTNSRALEQRPCLTINKTDSYCTQVENEQRQQRPRIKVDPVGGGATKRVADIIQGMIRHIENNKGGGDLTYDTAFGCAITGGFGYGRVLAEYCRDDGFEQDLYLAPIENPFSVYLGPHMWPDGSDCEEALITEMMKKADLKRQFPDADDGANFSPQGTGDGYQNWLNAEEIRVAEYYKLEREKKTLFLLSDGVTFFEDKPPPGLPEGVTVIAKRTSWTKQLHWYKITMLEILERKELPGKYIPIVPIYGKTSVIDGKKKRKGLVRNARDPAMQYNYWRTAMTESVGLAPKAKWMMAEGQDEGYENDWAQANTSAKAILRYKQTDVDGKEAPPPQRLQPEPPPQGVLVAAQSIGEDLSAVLGIVDPAVRIGGNVSGKALNAERQQSNNATFNFYDNLTRSIAQFGRIILDLIPYYYAEPGRIQRILGDDGKAKTVTLNQENPSPGSDTPGPIEAVLNDVTIGEYAVVMDTGPGYSTKRQEAVAILGPIFERNEKLMDVAGDLFFRNLDAPGSEIIADRMAAANPLAQIDENSEVPPGAQMKLKQQEMTIQQMQLAIQQLQQELKLKAGIEQMKQDGANKRTLMQTTAQTHIENLENEAWRQDTLTEAETRRHDTQVRADASIAVAEINQTGKLLDSQANRAHEVKVLEKTAAREEKESERK